MTRTTALTRWSIGTAAASLLVGLAATPAVARPDPGTPLTSPFLSNSQECPLSRVGTQLVSATT